MTRTSPLDMSVAVWSTRPWTILPVTSHCPGAPGQGRLSSSAAQKKSSEEWSVFIVPVLFVADEGQVLEGRRPAELRTIIRVSGLFTAVKEKLTLWLGTQPLASPAI